MHSKEKIRQVPFSQIQKSARVIAEDMDNMVNLPNMSAIFMLETLKLRYSLSKIYTYIGNIVVSVNPYKDLLIDGPEVMAKYFNRMLSSVPAHLYGLAETIYQTAVRGECDQIVVISGESGSGKTEAFKRITQYLACTSEQGKNSLSSVARRVLESTPVLESFGNATTLRNDNSSRFGKLVEIYFAKSIIVGAKITNFLLEKSRIVGQSEKERNYHVFYELLSSLDNESKAKHHLKNVEDYHYLMKDSKRTFSTHSDPDGLSMLLESWQTLGLPQDEMDLCLRVVSAVLHLGNIAFKSDNDKEKTFISNPFVAEIAASELGVDVTELTKVITMKLTETSIDSLWSPVNVAGAIVNRDSIAKSLYEEYFERLVRNINMKNAPPDYMDSDTKSSLRAIGLLDIYGFENLPTNSLEQFCINYTNENLQQFFNHYIFELEQEEYRAENISWQYVQFPDNQPIIDLIAGKPNGIMHLCNDEASLITGTDKSFLRQCQYHHQKHPNFKINKIQGNTSFTVVHFAGEIVYNVNGFVDKNREKIRGELLSLLTKSTNSAVATMFRNVQVQRTGSSGTGPKLKTSLVLTTMNNSLQQLMEKMRMNKPSFVRCIKPNMKKEPMVFDDAVVMDQLRYGGLLETVRIRKSGFPVRLSYKYFIERYSFLLNFEKRKQLKSISDTRESTAWILMNINIPFGNRQPIQKCVDYEFGKTKLFLRNQLAVNLESLRTIKELCAARTIQRAWRRRDNGLVERARRNSARVIQAWYRGCMTRRRHADIVQYLANRNKEKPISALPEDFSKIEKPLKSLSESEIQSLEVPSDLAYILQHRKITQDCWLRNHKVIKPAGSIRRFTPTYVTTSWQKYGRPLWHAAPISHLLQASGSVTQLGYRVAPRDRPLFLTRPTEKLTSACVAASKLILRLLFLPEMSLYEQFLVGSFLYQLALCQKSLHKEYLIQLLSMTINWPGVTEDLSASDPEDEASEFEPESKRSMYIPSKPNGPLVVKSRSSHSGIQRRAYRRLWMHVAGMLTCGQLSQTLTPTIVRFIRENAPVRSAQLCEDRVVLEPSVRRLYPPSLLEWRINYTGTHMGIKLTFPDGILSNFHVASFTRAETLAGMALALRTFSTRILQGWTVSVHDSSKILDVPGYFYILDIFSQQELPEDWSHLNNILLHQVLPSYAISKTIKHNSNRDGVTSTVGNSLSITNKYNNNNYKKLASSIHGIENTMNSYNGYTNTSNYCRGPSSQTQWFKAVRLMASKRFNESTRSLSSIRRKNIRKQSVPNSSHSTSVGFPRSKSPGDILQDSRLARASPTGLDSHSGRRDSNAVPRDLRYYTYDLAPWTVQIRKEFITPRERIRTSLILNLIFQQIVADINDERNLRLNADDRNELLSVIGKHRKLDSIESVHEIPMDIKKKALLTSFNLPIYFGRFYPVQSLDVNASPNLSQWLVVSHHGIRLVLQPRDCTKVTIKLISTLGEINKVTSSRTANRPRWRCGDSTSMKESQSTDHGKPSDYLKPPLSRSISTVTYNLLSLNHAKGTNQFYTEMAEKICELIELFLREYKEEMKRLQGASRQPAFRGHFNSSSPDTSSKVSTPEVAFRLVCSPALLSNELAEPTFDLEEEIMPRNVKNVDTKPPVIPRRRNRISSHKFENSTHSMIDSSDSLSSDSELHSPNPVNRPITPTNVKRTRSSSEHYISGGMNSLESGDITPIGFSSPHKRNLFGEFRRQQPDENPLLPFANQNFLNKHDLIQQLSWQSEPPESGSLLNHSDSVDVEVSKNIFKLIQCFAKEGSLKYPQNAVIKLLIEMLNQRPWLSDELYCQLAKQTFSSNKSNQDNHELVWLLWKLLTIFIPTSDTLRPYLIKYIGFQTDNQQPKFQACLDTTIQNMEIVSRYGPRKHLPPDNILQSFIDGHFIHRQEIYFTNKRNTTIPLGQLCLTQDVVHNVINKLGASFLNSATDFALFLISKNSSFDSCSNEPLIPLPLDTYLLDAPIYHGDFLIYFRRICWTVPLDLQNIPRAYLDFLFDQVVDEYLAGHWLPDELTCSLNELYNQCLHLSCVLHQCHESSVSISSTIAASLKPKNLQISVEKWSSGLNAILKSAQSKDPEDSQKVFISSLRNWPLFGSSCFLSVIENGPPGIPTNREVLVALSHSGIHILDSLTHKCYQIFAYEDIASTRVNYKDNNDYNCIGSVRLTTSNGQQLILCSLQ
ncbi:Unconventional myosin-XV, partial [Schistosoma japonicum]